MSEDIEHKVRRLIYRSVPTHSGSGDDLRKILAAARLNNGLEGVSGLLLATQFDFLQILEGSPESVEYIFRRIQSDERHFAINVLSDEACERPAFGDWAMASIDDDDAAIVRRSIDRFLAVANDRVRQSVHAVISAAPTGR